MRRADGRLRKTFRERMPDFHWTSVETGAIMGGVPDSEYCWDGCQGWVEHKWTDAWAVKFQPGQTAWMLRRARAGGRATLAVRRSCAAGPRRPPTDELFLFRGWAAALVEREGLRGAAVAGAGLLYHGFNGPARWDWVAVRAALLRPPDAFVET